MFTKMVDANCLLYPAAPQYIVACIVYRSMYIVFCTVYCSRYIVLRLAFSVLYIVPGILFSALRRALILSKKTSNGSKRVQTAFQNIDQSLEWRGFPHLPNRK